MKIEIGSIIREEGIFYEEAEEYRIVMIQPEPKKENINSDCLTNVVVYGICNI